MATHDYVIDNQTAPNFRADLNNALLAIVSNNSSATAPAVTYANMMWCDTAANILYIRNEDNDAWIRLGTLDQTADTFSASVALASQAEAEAGTDNTKVMTPLRVIQSIAANTPEAYTDAQARAAQAGHAAGGVGSYAFMRYTATTGNNTQISLEMNSTVAGSLLRYSGADVDANSNEVVNIVDSGVIPVGTWRLMGHFFYGISSSVRNQGPRYSLWLRIL